MVLKADYKALIDKLEAGLGPQKSQQVNAVKRVSR